MRSALNYTLVIGLAKKAISFASFQVCVNPVKIVSVLRRISVSCGVDFAQDFVFPRFVVR